MVCVVQPWTWDDDLADWGRATAKAMDANWNKRQDPFWGSRRIPDCPYGRFGRNDNYFLVQAMRAAWLEWGTIPEKYRRYN